jgi:hypothetical protein
MNNRPHIPNREVDVLDVPPPLFTPRGHIQQRTLTIKPSVSFCIFRNMLRKPLFLLGVRLCLRPSISMKPGCTPRISAGVQPLNPSTSSAARPCTPHHSTPHNQSAFGRVSTMPGYTPSNPAGVQPLKPQHQQGSQTLHNLPNYWTAKPKNPSHTCTFAAAALSLLSPPPPRRTPMRASLL